MWVCALDVGPLSDLLGGTMGINGFGGVYTQPLGYVIIRLQVEESESTTKIKWS